jgi:hypothetical protein
MLEWRQYKFNPKNWSLYILYTLQGGGEKYTYASQRLETM